MKGPTVLLPLLFVCTCFLLGVSSLGTLHVDYIYPLTEDTVTIPSVAADHFIGTTTTASNIRGDFPEGFNVNALGGISLRATGDHVVNVPGDISYSAPISGDVGLFANTVDIHSQEDVNIWAASSGVFNVANDLQIENVIGVGDFRIQSYLSTKVDAIHGVEIGSLFRELNILAPNGIAELNSDIISFTTGDVLEPTPSSLFLQSNDTVDIRATKTFIIDSETIDFETVEDIVITSNVHNVEIETLHLLEVTATSNVILKTVSNTHFETFLGDFVAQSEGVVSLYAHGSFFYASDIQFSSDNLVRFDSTGSVRLTDTSRTEINAQTINLEALGKVELTTTTGNIDITLDESNVFSQNIYFTVSHTKGSVFSVSTAQQLSFVTSDSDIHFESTFTDLTSEGNILYQADSDIYLVAVRHSNQANFISPDGFSTYAADKDLVIAADIINLKSNGGIIIDDSTSIATYADKALNILSHNLFYQSSTKDITYQSATATFSAGHDNSFTANVIDSSFDIATHYATGEIIVNAEPTKASNIIIDSDSLNLFSSEGGVTFDARTFVVNAVRRIDFQNDFDGLLGNQEFKATAGAEILFFGAEAYFTSGSSNNLLAPTGAIVTTSEYQTQYSGNEGIFKSVTGSVHFNQGEFSANGNNINLRAGEAIQWNSEGFSVSMTGSVLEFESGSDIELVSNLLSFDAAGDLHFDADNSIFVISQGELPFIATDSIDIEGGDIAFNSVKSTNIAARKAEISTAKGDISFSGAVINQFAVNDISYAGASFSLFGEKESNIAGGDLLFTSTSNNVTFVSDGDFSVANAGNTNFAADFLQSNSYDDFLVTLNNDFYLTADSASITTQDSIHFEAAGSFYITGTNMDTTLATFQFDFGTYTIDESNEWTACSGDVRLNVGTYTYTSEGSLPIFQQVDPCGACGDECEPGNFEIVSRSNRTQTINTNAVSFVGDNSILINGGAVLFQTLDYGYGSINLTTDNGVTFESSNFANHLLSDPQNDVVTASDNLNIVINGAAQFVANGFDNNYAYPNYGILMETNVDPLYSKNTNYTVKVPKGEIIENAAKVLRIATFKPLDNTAASLNPLSPYPDFLGQYQDLSVAVTRDILFDAGLGAITTISGGQLNDDDDSLTVEDDDEYEDNSSINFRAVVGDITAKAVLSQMIFNTQYLFSAESLADSITFTSFLDQSHSSQRKDGDLYYHSNFGVMNFNDKLDTSIIAGSPLQDASIDATASNQIYITSGQSQVYQTTGANADPSGISINIIGEEGGILVDTPSTISFYSSAREEVTAATGVLNVNANNNIDFLADGRIDFISQLTSNFTVTNGNIGVNAFGGGGSVTITSDDGQDISGVAGRSIEVAAAKDSVIYANTGISAVSNTGDISLSNSGVNKNMFFLSQGSVVLQAAATQGVQIFGNSFHANAFQDVSIDTSLFTVGSTSQSTTATEPIIKIHAGGDSSLKGLTVKSTGEMQWTTGEDAGVQFVGQTIDIEATIDVQMITNGPILFENLSEENDGTFTITATTGSLTVNGNENAAIVGVTSAQFTTEKSITFESIGNDAANGVEIRSRRDLTIKANEFDMEANNLEAELTDFQVQAELITIQNTVGDAGTLTFDSTLNLDATSTGPVLITSLGPTTISTLAAAADVNINARSDLTLTSGDSTFFSAISMDVDAPEGISFTSTGGAIQFTASDDVTLIANQTLSVNGRQSLEISTGTLDSVFYITSTGKSSFVAPNDVAIDTVGGSVIVTGNDAVRIENRIPTRPRDQGDIYIQSYGELDFASGDRADYSVGRYYEVTVEDDSRYIFGGDVSFTASAVGSAIFLNAEAGGFEFQAGALMSIDTTTLSITATEDFTWDQTYEEGFGGITITSSGNDAAFSISSGGNVAFGSTTSIQGTSDQYISFFSRNALTIRSQAAEGDVVFNSLHGNVEIDIGGRFSYSAPVKSSENKVIIESFASQSLSDTNSALYVESTIDTISFETTHHQSIITTSQGHVIFATADLPDRDITSTSGSKAAFVSNGIDPSGLYGIYVETDDEIVFNAGTGVLTAHSEKGVGYFYASESYTITPQTRANFIAGDDFTIETGFTPQPNAELSRRIGIQLKSQEDILISANIGDVAFTAEDSSWSVFGTISMRSSSNGGRVSFSTSSSPATITSATAVFSPTQLEFFAQNDFTLDVVGTATISVVDDFTIQGDEILNLSADTSITINNAQGDIIFSTPSGFVNFQATSGSSQTLLIPSLEYQAGLTQNNNAYSGYVFGPTNALTKFRYSEEVESEYPGCEERAFGFDEISETMCICDFNKWRCVETDGQAYYDNLSNYYPTPVILPPPQQDPIYPPVI